MAKKYCEICGRTMRTGVRYCSACRRDAKSVELAKQSRKDPVFNLVKLIFIEILLGFLLYFMLRASELSFMKDISILVIIAVFAAFLFWIWKAAREISVAKAS